MPCSAQTLGDDREVSCPSFLHPSTKDIGSEFEGDRAPESQKLKEK